MYTVIIAIVRENLICHLKELTVNFFAAITLVLLTGAFADADNEKIAIPAGGRNCGRRRGGA